MYLFAEGFIIIETKKNHMFNYQYYSKVLCKCYNNVLDGKFDASSKDILKKERFKFNNN